MDAVLKTRWICDQARAVGFDLCGVVSVPAPGKTFDELQYLPDWLNRGHAGEMNYLHDPRRANPALAMNGARSLIVVAFNYNSEQPYSTEAMASNDDVNSPRGWISRYAWGDDYHEVLWDKLNSLVAAMRTQWPEPFDARAYVDTGPIIERVAAKYAGLGWLAKNTCLINQEIGSWLFLGVIITTLDLGPSFAPQESPAPDRCGTCTLCLDACPTNAFSEPYVLDARRCISYLTIELRTAIPEDLRPAIGNAVIGCDICQDVCPWNRKAPITTLAAFQPRDRATRRKEYRNWRERKPARRDALRSRTRMAGVAHPAGIQFNFSRQRRQARQMARPGSQRLRGAGQFENSARLRDLPSRARAARKPRGRLGPAYFRARSVGHFALEELNLRYHERVTVSRISNREAYR